jgi:hypothetical protein
MELEEAVGLCKYGNTDSACRIEAIKAILNNGVNVNSKPLALYQAVNQQDIDVIVTLIEAGADFQAAHRYSGWELALARYSADMQRLITNTRSHVRDEDRAVLVAQAVAHDASVESAQIAIERDIELHRNDARPEPEVAEGMDVETSTLEPAADINANMTDIDHATISQSVTDSIYSHALVEECNAGANGPALEMEGEMAIDLDAAAVTSIACVVGGLMVVWNCM